MKFLVVAPFWKNARHVGRYRVDRFVRWLSAREVPIVLVRAGNSSRVAPASWGLEVVIEEPIALHGDTTGAAPQAPAPRAPNKLRQWIARRVLIPDHGMLWALKAAFHPLVRKHARGVTHVLASSPRESVHVAAYLLSQALGAQQIVDLRDGWLDDPLNALLRQPSLRRRVERWMEGAILKHAAHVFVTSEGWQALLHDRRPFTRGKTTVLTNAYPAPAKSSREIVSETASNEEERSARVRLMHVGRFTGSRRAQRPAPLLRVLLEGVRRTPVSGCVVLLGELTEEDVQAASCFAPRFEAAGWTLEINGHVPRAEALAQMRASDGLLLLAASQAPIPSKLFEYIPAGKPILAVTPAGSAVERICRPLAQAHVVHPGQQHTAEVVRFLEHTQQDRPAFDVPAAFSEEMLARRFHAAIEKTRKT